MAKFSGNFLTPPAKENILFYRGHVQIPAETEITKINGEYYVYSLLSGKSPGNYSMVISNVEYFSGGKVREENIEKNFSITENLADFSVNPGFIVTKTDFYIEVRNFKDTSLEVQINANETNLSENTTEKGFFATFFGTEEVQTTQATQSTAEDSFTIPPGETKKIYFKVSATQPIFKILRLSSENSNYEIPVFIFEKTMNATPSGEGLEFNPSELDLVINANSNFSESIFLHNYLNYSLNNVLLSISESIKPYVSLSSYEISSLGKNSSIKLNLTFYSTEEKLIKGNITATAQTNFSVLMPIEITFVGESVYIPPQEKEIPAISKTCAENNGIICNSTEKCDAEEITAKDDKCCLGTCKPIEKSSTGKLIGWTLLIVITGIIIWYLKVQSKKRNEINLLETAKTFLKKK
jgi:hypothetical protein